MKEKLIPIQDIRAVHISGVEIDLFHPEDTHAEDYFEWTPIKMLVPFSDSNITGGYLQIWHHTPTFRQIETHKDDELFFYVSGTALMMFCDVHDNEVVEDSLQIVRIPPKTQVRVMKGKGHFVAVAEGDDPVCAIVVSPQQDAPRIDLPWIVHGTK